MDPVHGPPRGPGLWTTPWTTPLSFVVHVGNVENMEEGEKRKASPFYSLGCSFAHTFVFSIYTLSDLGVLSNLIGSLSLANEHYSPPTEWIMRKPNKNKMAGVNSRFASVSESIFNGFLLKMFLRSLPVYILKQLFFSISVNSGRILTSPLRGSVNILPLFTEIEKNNC